MRKIKIGDVFEIATPKGKAYFQHVFQHKTIGELIRILPGLYQEKPQDMSPVVADKELYFIHFPLKVAYKQGIVDLIGNFDMPEKMEIPTQFRSIFPDRQGNIICWHIVNYETWKRESVKELSAEQLKLSSWGTWNDTLLIERLVESWTPEKWVSKT